MKNEGALRMRFSGMAESIGRCVITSCKPGPEYRIPVGSGPGYRTRRKETRSTHRRDEFRPAIPQRVARQHCPSPLHRHHQLKTIAASNGIIYHRTVPSLLTVCLTHRDNPTRQFSGLVTLATRPLLRIRRTWSAAAESNRAHRGCNSAARHLLLRRMAPQV